MVMRLALIQVDTGHYMPKMVSQPKAPPELLNDLVCFCFTHCLHMYLTTLLTSPIEFSLYFQNYVRHLNQNFREARKIYEMGLRSKIMRVNLLYKAP